MLLSILRASITIIIEEHCAVTCGISRLSACFRASYSLWIIDKHLMPICFRERCSCGIPGLISNALHSFLLLIPMSAIPQCTTAVMYNRNGCLLWAIRSWSIDPQAYFSSIETRCTIARIATEDRYTVP